MLEPTLKVELPAAGVSSPHAASAVRGVSCARHDDRLDDVLGWAPLDPPMTKTSKFVTPTGSRLSPETQEVVRIAVDLLGRARRP